MMIIAAALHFNPERIASTQPRVATCRAVAQRRRGNELPWEIVITSLSTLKELNQAE
jgi:hypothetical protein